mgnify:CR=1 FL=1
MAKPLLMIPGPTEIPLRVIRAMVRASEPHYTPPVNPGLIEEVMDKLRRVYRTQGEVILLPGSGRMGLEAALASIVEPGDRVLVVVAGEFGRMIPEIVKRVGGVPVEFRVPPGGRLDESRLEEALKRGGFKALAMVHNEPSTGTLYPAEGVGRLARRYGVLYLLGAGSSLGGVDVRVDEWGVDLCISCSHKCLAAPMGLAMVSVSERAWEVMEDRKTPPVTFLNDLYRWRRLWIPRERGGLLEQGLRRVPITLPVHLLYALNEALDIVLEEGLEARFERHRTASRAFVKAVEAMGLEILPEERLSSPTVTAVKVPEGVDDSKLRRRILDYGVLVAGGLSELRGRIFRVGHMAETASERCIRAAVTAVGLALRDMGLKADVGLAVEEVSNVFGEV